MVELENMVAWLRDTVRPSWLCMKARYVKFSEKVNEVTIGVKLGRFEGSVTFDVSTLDVYEAMEMPMCFDVQIDPGVKGAEIDGIFFREAVYLPDRRILFVFFRGDCTVLGRVGDSKETVDITRPGYLGEGPCIVSRVVRGEDIYLENLCEHGFYAEVGEVTLGEATVNAEAYLVELGRKVKQHVPVYVFTVKRVEEYSVVVTGSLTV